MVREDYLTYLGAVRNLSPHTLESYGKDLENTACFCSSTRRDRRASRNRRGTRLRELAQPRGAFPPIGEQDDFRRARMVSLHGESEPDRLQSFCGNPQPAHREAAAFVPFRR